MRTLLPALILFAACAEPGPEIASTYLPPGAVDEVYSAPLTAFGGEAPLRWTLAEGTSLPEGLTLNPAGAISGLPAEPTSGEIQVMVEDARGLTDLATLDLEIAYKADVLLCGSSVEGELLEAGLVDFELDPTITDGVAWVSVALPAEDVTRIDIDVGLHNTSAYGFIYLGAPGTEPGDTNLDHYLARSFLLSSDVVTIDLNTTADLEAYRAHGDPITLLFGATAPTGWRLEAECSDGPIFQDLLFDPVRVGQTVLTNYNVIGENTGVRIWTDDPLPEWLTWDESNGRLGGIAEEAGVWPVTVNAQADGGPLRTEQTWITTWEPIPLTCGESVDFSTEESYRNGALSSWRDPRGYAVFEASPPNGVSGVVARLEGPEDSYISWSDPDSPYFPSQQVETVDGVATTEVSPASWPTIGEVFARGQPLTAMAYNTGAAADMRLGITCDTSPRPDVGTLPVLTESDTFELPSIGGTGALTWGGLDFPDGVLISDQGVLTSERPTPGRYDVSITIEDEEGQRSGSSFSLDVGWASACQDRTPIACGDTMSGTFTQTVFDGAEGSQELLCVVHQVEMDGRVSLTLSVGEGAQVIAEILDPTEQARATAVFASGSESSVMFVGRGASTPLQPWLDRIIPLNLEAYQAGDWSLKVDCD